LQLHAGAPYSLFWRKLAFLLITEPLSFISLLAAGIHSGCISRPALVEEVPQQLLAPDG
jgi:hypothetical protein